MSSVVRPAMVSVGRITVVCCATPVMLCIVTVFPAASASRVATSLDTTVRSDPVSTMN